MTGPEHYREGEKSLASAEALGIPVAWDGEISQAAVLLTAQAQAHFTAALAAATALGREGEGRTMASQDRAEWFDAAAECRKEATA
jgi:hypothetical protein